MSQQNLISEELIQTLKQLSSEKFEIVSGFIDRLKEKGGKVEIPIKAVCGCSWDNKKSVFAQCDVHSKCDGSSWNVLLGYNFASTPGI